MKRIIFSLCICFIASNAFAVTDVNEAVPNTFKFPSIFNEPVITTLWFSCPTDVANEADTALSVVSFPIPVDKTALPCTEPLNVITVVLASVDVILAGIITDDPLYTVTSGFGVFK